MHRLPPNILRKIAEQIQPRNLASLASTSKNMSKAFQPDIIQAAHAGNFTLFKKLVCKMNLKNPAQKKELFQALKTWAMRHDNEKALAFVIEERPGGVVYFMGSYREIADISLMHDHPKPFLYLLNTFARFQTSSNWLLRALSNEKIKVATVIVEKFPDQVWHSFPGTYRTAFHYAYMFPTSVIYRMLREDYRGFQRRDRHGRTVLDMIAAVQDQRTIPVNTLRYIVSKMSKEKTIPRDVHGRRALYAIIMRNPEILDALSRGDRSRVLNVAVVPRYGFDTDDQSRLERLHERYRQLFKNDKNALKLVEMAYTRARQKWNLARRSIPSLVYSTLARRTPSSLPIPKMIFNDMQRHHAVPLNYHKKQSNRRIKFRKNVRRANGN